MALHLPGVSLPRGSFPGGPLLGELHLGRTAGLLYQMLDFPNETLLGLLCELTTQNG